MVVGYEDQDCFDLETCDFSFYPLVFSSSALSMECCRVKLLFTQFLEPFYMVVNGTILIRELSLLIVAFMCLNI